MQQCMEIKLGVNFQHDWKDAISQSTGSGVGKTIDRDGIIATVIYVKEISVYRVFLSLIFYYNHKIVNTLFLFQYLRFEIDYFRDFLDSL